MEPCPTKR
jgi:two-component system, OmpR family, phosphate regulon response regulator PhoB